MLTHLAYMVKDAFESAENVAYFFNEQQEAFTELAVLALISQNVKAIALMFEVLGDLLAKQDDFSELFFF